MIIHCDFDLWLCKYFHITLVIKDWCSSQYITEKTRIRSVWDCKLCEDTLISTIRFCNSFYYLIYLKRNKLVLRALTPLSVGSPVSCNCEKKFDFM